MKGKVHDLPTPREVREAARATGSTQAELRAFLSRPLPPRPHPVLRLARPALAGALAGALITLFVVLALGRGHTPGPASVSAGTQLVLDGGANASLGPSVALTGLGRVTVAESGPERTVVDLEHGAVRFVFHPSAGAEALLVRAGAVEVEVTGTIFEVQRLDRAVRVAVEQGRVLVHHRGVSHPLLAGDDWAYAPPEPQPPAPTPEEEAVPEPAPEASPEPPPPHPSIAAFASLRARFAAGEEPGGVLEDVDAFLTRWPDSPQDLDARVLAIDLSQQVEGPSQVVARIDALLSRYPDSSHRSGLASLRARLVSAPTEPNRDSHGR